MHLLLENERSFFWAASVFYCFAFFLASCSLSKNRKYSRLILLTFIPSAFLLQSIGLYFRGLETGSCPLNNPFEIVQFITWTIILLYIVIGPTFRMSLLGFFSAGLVAGLSLLSLLIPQWDQPSNLLSRNSWAEVHASTALFSYGVFGLLSLTSMMYLIQNYGLKNKRFQGLSPFLPSIVQLDKMNNRLLFIGTVILGISMGIGLTPWLIHDGQQHIPNLKLIAAVLVWGAYSLVLILRWNNLLLSRKFAWACLLLFTGALISLWPIETNHSLPKAPSTCLPH